MIEQERYWVGCWASALGLPDSPLLWLQSTGSWDLSSIWLLAFSKQLRSSSVWWAGAGPSAGASFSSKQLVVCPCEWQLFEFVFLTPTWQTLIGYYKSWKKNNLDNGQDELPHVINSIGFNNIKEEPRYWVKDCFMLRFSLLTLWCIRVVIEDWTILYYHYSSGNDTGRGEIRIASLSRARYPMIIQCRLQSGLGLMPSIDLIINQGFFPLWKQIPCVPLSLCVCVRPLCVIITNIPFSIVNS